MQCQDLKNHIVSICYVEINNTFKNNANLSQQ